MKNYCLTINIRAFSGTNHFCVLFLRFAEIKMEYVQLEIRLQY